MKIYTDYIYRRNIKRIRSCINKEDYLEALNIMKPTIKLNPQEAQLYYVAAGLNSILEDFLSALTMIRQARKIDKRKFSFQLQENILGKNDLFEYFI